MLVVFFRTIVLYLVVVIALRLMGKRQIGQLQPSELVIAIMISEVASIPMQNTGVPLLSGLVPVLTLIIAEVILSFVSLKSRKMRRLLSGKPSILIDHGKIKEKELEKSRFNIEDLLEELRMNNYPDITEVEYAVLETSGQLSIVPKTEARPATVKDLNLNRPPTQRTHTIVSDGMVDEPELQQANKDIRWLKKQLAANNIERIEDVFLATIDSNGSLFVQLKEGTRK